MDYTYDHIHPVDDLVRAYARLSDRSLARTAPVQERFEPIVSTPQVSVQSKIFGLLKGVIRKNIDTIHKAFYGMKKYLENIGYTSMRESYYSVYDGVCTINFAYTENGIIHYSDLIKVSVSLETGKVVALDASGHLMNHTERDIYDEKITAEQAKMGYVGAFTYAEVISGYTSFYLGAKSVCPSVTMEVQFTGSWYDEIKEKEAATALINNGCVLISQHADSEGAPKACEEAGVPNVAYNGETGKNTFVIASRIDWVPYYEYMLDCVMNGKDIDADWTGTLANGAVKITALGSAAAAGTQAKLDEVAAKLNDGSLKVFDCSTFTVNGANLTEYLADVDDAGDFVPETNVIRTENGITFFDESADRSAPYFDIRIDGITEVQ